VSRASSTKRSFPSIKSRITWRLEIEQRHQPGHSDLTLMVLGQHEAAPLRFAKTPV
jgi:hypothetical protein